MLIVMEAAATAADVRRVVETVGVGQGFAPQDLCPLALVRASHGLTLRLTPGRGDRSLRLAFGMNGRVTAR